MWQLSRWFRAWAGAWWSRTAPAPSASDSVRAVRDASGGPLRAVRVWSHRVVACRLDVSAGAVRAVSRDAALLRLVRDDSGPSAVAWSAVPSVLRILDASGSITRLAIDHSGGLLFARPLVDGSMVWRAADDSGSPARVVLDASGSAIRARL